MTRGWRTGSGGVFLSPAPSLQLLQLFMSPLKATAPARLSFSTASLAKILALAPLPGEEAGWELLSHAPWRKCDHASSPLASLGTCPLGVLVGTGR